MSSFSEKEYREGGNRIEPWMGTAVTVFLTPFRFTHLPENFFFIFVIGMCISMGNQWLLSVSSSHATQGANRFMVYLVTETHEKQSVNEEKAGMNAWFNETAVISRPNWFLVSATEWIIRKARQFIYTSYRGWTKVTAHYPFLQITVTSLIFNQFLQLLAFFVYGDA